ncbi:MAG: hypothetical protein K2N78_12510 [Oscillospiraceae bacterium]|nr:hypothetical protein [Oscillospiraceae bacterium]
MKNKKRTVILFVSIIAFAAIIGLFALKSLSDYSMVLKLNWNVALPTNSHYSEIYNQDSGASFHGDGIRYHIFAYRDGEPVSKMFEWQSEEKNTNYRSSYSGAVDEWLNQIDVPSKERPNYAECVYWYQSHSDNSEIVILWDEGQGKLYVVESLL